MDMKPLDLGNWVKLRLFALTTKISWVAKIFDGSAVLNLSILFVLSSYKVSFSPKPTGLALLDKIHLSKK